jgi:hypothetical protein
MQSLEIVVALIAALVGCIRVAARSDRSYEGGLYRFVTDPRPTQSDIDT